MKNETYHQCHKRITAKGRYYYSPDRCRNTAKYDHNVLGEPQAVAGSTARIVPRKGTADADRDRRLRMATMERQNAHQAKCKSIVAQVMTGMTNEQLEAFGDLKNYSLFDAVVTERENRRIASNPVGIS